MYWENWNLPVDKEEFFLIAQSLGFIGVMGDSSWFVCDEDMDVVHSERPYVGMATEGINVYYFFHALIRKFGGEI